MRTARRDLPMNHGPRALPAWLLCAAALAAPGCTKKSPPPSTKPEQPPAASAPSAPPAGAASGSPSAASAAATGAARGTPATDEKNAPRRPGDLPPEAGAILEDLLADDARVVEVDEVNDFVDHLTFERGGRRYGAKWKALGPGGSERQDGVDGNNAPRCETAAYRVNELIFGPRDTTRYVVAPTVVRALHRDVPCDRACARIPRLPKDRDHAATFPEHNDHLVLGALTFWIDDVRPPRRFRGGLWDEQRFAAEPAYRRSVSDLLLFVFLINHGDANMPMNFLQREDGADRFYSIDNGIAFDGDRYYVSDGNPDWDPLKDPSLDRIPVPSYDPETLRAIAALDRETLRRELRVTAAVDLASGRAPHHPAAEPLLQPLLAKPPAAWGWTKRSRSLFTGSLGGRPWVVMGLTEAGIDDVAARAALAAKRTPSPRPKSAGQQ